MQRGKTKGQFVLRIRWLFVAIHDAHKLLARARTTSGVLPVVYGLCTVAHHAYCVAISA